MSEEKHGRGSVPVEEGEILVHQARYIVYDNCKLYFFFYY